MQISGVQEKKIITNHYETERIFTMAMCQMPLVKNDKEGERADTHGLSLWLWKEK